MLLISLAFTTAFQHPAHQLADRIERLAPKVFSQPGQQPTHPQQPHFPMLSDASTPDGTNVAGVFEHDSTDRNDRSIS